MKTSGWTAILACLVLSVSCANSEPDQKDYQQVQQKERSGSVREFGGGGWRDLIADISGEVFLGAQKGVIFYAHDVLTYPNEPVELVAEVRLAKMLVDVGGVSVGFYLDSELIGMDRTDKSGRAGISWTPAKAGNFLFTARITAVPDKDYKDMLEISPAPLLVAAREKDTKFVVIDLDHTVVSSSFFVVLIGGASPMPGSVRVTREIAKEYGIIYLTQRPNLLTVRSKQWLRDEGFPQGPLLLSDLEQALRGSGRFKTSRLAVVRKSFPNVAIGIGDKPSDAQAYVDNGMRAYLLPHYKEKAKHLRKMAKKIRQLRGQGRLQVVKDWEQIEEGIFKGKQFSPNDFVSYLDRRAEQLQREDDDDDDDDD